MKKIKPIIKMTIVIAITLAFALPESAIEINDILYKNMQTILDGGDAPNIIINFAGNLDDSGGPHWAVLAHEFTYENGIPAWDGYYTNDSRQQENWMYILVTVSDEDNDIDHVWLNWLEGNSWTNLTYEFTYVGPYYENAHLYEIWTNESGITTAEGYKYSFDVVANDLAGNSKTVRWEKVGIGGDLDHKTRRYVQLNCTPADEVGYTPFYLRNYTSETGIYERTSRKDRFHHDQGPDGSLTDTGYLNSTLPSDTIEGRKCGRFTGYWFEDSVCIEPFELENIYFHYWYNSYNGDLGKAGWSKSRSSLGLDFIDFYDPPGGSHSQSHIILNDSHYYLKTHLLQTTPTLFTDNDIYELSVIFDNFQGGRFDSPPPPSGGIKIRTISNRSFVSFVIFNVPDDVTLNTSYVDSDGDDLTDWTELYVTYTNPFLVDTDDDSATDYEEVKAEIYGYLNSDPNDYTDTTEYRRVSPGGPYVGLINEPLQFTGSVVSGSPPYSWHWDFGDDITSDMQNPLHEYTTTGIYTITLNVSDSGNYSDSDSTIATIGDLNARISKPESAIYFNNEMIIPRLFLKTPIIIGSIDLEIEATDSYSGVNKVEFYIDNQLKETDTIEPYSWRWNERTLSKHKLKVVAYDTIGNIVSDEIDLWKFF